METRHNGIGFGFGVLLAGLLLVSCQSAHADLVLAISGTPGSGETTWTFSGEGVATATATGGNSATGGAAFFEWIDVGDFTVEPFGFFTPTSGSASITNVTTTDSHSFISVLLDDDDPSSDEIGVRTDSNLSYSTGDVISWGGFLVVPVDVNQLTAPFSSLNNTVGPSEGRGFGLPKLDLSITAIPEPSQWMIFSILAITIGAYRRFHQKH